MWTRALTVSHLQPGLVAPPPFRDAAAIPAWAQAGAEYAARAGLIAGFPDGTFRPNARMTRAQMAEVLWRFLTFGLPQAAG